MGWQRRLYVEEMLGESQEETSPVTTETISISSHRSWVDKDNNAEGNYEWANVKITPGHDYKPGP